MFQFLLLLPYSDTEREKEKGERKEIDREKEKKIYRQSERKTEREVKEK